MCSDNIHDRAIYARVRVYGIGIGLCARFSRRTLECLRAWKSESRDIDDAAERVGCGKIIDRSCLDNYGYPMRRAYLQFHGPPPPPLHRERDPAIPPHSCIWSRWSIAATDSRNYIRLTTATNNYPRATFRVPSGDSRDPSQWPRRWTHYHLISRYQR